ncbi:MAG TPA: TetR/AcrR family transcriptional regulator [Polyangiaceae bacterium]|nr:TetR/AcrR family transcriptional regulator [Polyangiaceae bacterium]
MSASAVSQAGTRQGSTRERLLEAAIEMFAERGYAATGVDALCRRAGVAKTGLYWEFQNKVGLLNAVIDQVVTEWVDQIREAACAAGSPRERLDVALKMVRRRIQERPEVFRVLLVVLAERTQVDEEAREALRRFYTSAHSALLSGFQESIGSALPAEKISLICDFVLAAIEGVLLRAQVYGTDDIDRLFDVIRASVILLVRELMTTGHSQSNITSLLAGPTGEAETGTE